jgi:hypothetical protein
MRVAVDAPKTNSRYLQESGTLTVWIKRRGDGMKGVTDSTTLVASDRDFLSHPRQKFIGNEAARLSASRIGRQAMALFTRAARTMCVSDET